MIQFGHRFVLYFIQQDRKSYPYKQIQRNKYRVIRKCVACDLPSITRGEQVLEVVPTAPGTAPYSVGVIHIFECNQDAEHRHVVVHQQKQNPW